MTDHGVELGMNDIMLDIETLGKDYGCDVLSVGALRFDRSAPDLSGAEPFYRVLRLRDRPPAHQHLFKVDADTLCWWMEQNDQARISIFGEEAQKGAVTAPVMWEHLVDFLRRKEVKRLWSNGPMFDERIVRDAMSSFGLVLPVEYRASRCCRTKYDDAKQWWGEAGAKKKLAAAEIRRVPEAGRLPKHHALGDCWRQAAHTQEIHQRREPPRSEQQDTEERRARRLAYAERVAREVATWSSKKLRACYAQPEAVKAAEERERKERE